MQIVLFDIDGTLIRGEGMGSLAMKQALEETFAVSAVGNERLKSIPFNGRSDPAILADMADVLGISQDRFTRSFDQYKAAFLSKLKRTVADSKTKRVLPGVDAVVRSLHRSPAVQLGLATGNFHQGARIKLEPFKLNSYFPFGGFGDDGADRRNIVEAAYIRAQEHVGREIPPGDVLVVGDTVRDVDAAKAHDFCTVGVETGGVAGADFEGAGADAWFSQLDQGFGSFLDTWVRHERPPS